MKDTSQDKCKYNVGDTIGNLKWKLRLHVHHPCCTNLQVLQLHEKAIHPSIFQYTEVFTLYSTSRQYITALLQ